MALLDPKTVEVQDILSRLRPRRQQRWLLKAALGIGFVLCGAAMDRTALALWDARPIDVADHILIQAEMLREAELTGESVAVIWTRSMRDIGVAASSAMTHAQARTLEKSLADRLVVLAGPSLRAPNTLLALPAPQDNNVPNLSR